MDEYIPPPDAPPVEGRGAVIPFRKGDKRVTHLPHNLSAEQSVLGGILIRNDVLDEIDWLEVDDFYDPRHRHIFGAIRNLQADGTPLDPVTLEEELDRAGKFEACGGHEYLGQIALKVPTPENVVYYARIIHRHRISRQVTLRIAEVVAEVQRGHLDGHAAISELSGEFQRIAEQPSPIQEARSRWVIPLVEFLGEEEPDDNDAEDWVIRDLVPRGEPALVAGPPKTGKTWLTLDVALSVALGTPWLGDAFENTMPGPSRVLVLAFEDARRRLRKRVWELGRARGITPNDPLLREHLSISQVPLRLPGDARAFAAEVKRWKPAVVLVDNLTRVMVGDQNSTRDASAFTKQWTQICQDVGSAVVFLHHTTKSSPVPLSGGDDEARERDPFDTVRGSGDFLAAARNALVTRPIPIEGAELAELRIRGNLDLRRSALAYSFARTQRQDGRWVAKLTDAGDPTVLKAEAKAKKAEAKKAAKKAEQAKEHLSRKEVAVRIARDAGNVTSRSLAAACEVSSNTALAVLQRLEAEGVLARSPDKNGGFVLPPTEAP